jgi:endonuclease/exonuclease/phosphatase family metal-dependent hydrolase
MNLRTVTWNIGGGKLLKEGEDPGLMASYTVDGIDVIAAQIAALNPDIVTIQEAHGDDDDNQIAQIAKQLGYKYFIYDAITDSHIDSTYKLGNGLISRFPISDVETGRFLNPELNFELEGRKAFTHDKGYISCKVKIGDTAIYATSLHLIPFRIVGIDFDSDIARQILASVSAEIKDEESNEYRLIQGDFNINSDTVRTYLEELFSTDRLDEVELDQPTTPKERMYDHALYRGLKLGKFSVDSDVLTDHYPVICDFEIEE